MSKKKFATRRIGEAVSVSAPLKQQEHQATGFNSQTNWFLLLILVLPFIISREAIDPTITSRYLTLGIFVSAFVLYFYIFRKETLHWNFPSIIKAVFICGLAYALWSLVSISFSINKPAGYYELLRFLLNFSLLFLVMQAVSKEGLKIMKVIQALVIVALLQSFVGIFQYYELAFNELPGANAKPYGLMANRNLFGSAQMLLLPFIIYVGVKAKTLWRSIAIVSGLLTTFSIILSQTRSAWLATLAITVIAFILVVIYSPSLRKKWIAGTAICLAVTLLLGFLLTFGNAESELGQSIAERAASFTSANDGKSESANNVQERFKVWKKTSRLIADHSLFGVGLSNWKLVICSYGTEGLAWSRGFFVPDSPHNLYLQQIAETGIPGALLYFSMFALIAFAGLSRLKRMKEDERLLTILMLAGLCGFATDGMFSFPADRIEHSVYLAFMAGIILGFCLRSTERNAFISNAGRKLGYLLLLIAAGNVFLGIQKHNFEVHLSYAKSYELAGRYEEVINEAKNGKNAFVNMDMVGTSLEAKASIAYNELKDYPQALKEAQRALKLHPHSPMILNTIGTIYTNMGDFPKAIRFYNQALLYVPNYEVVLKNLAVNYFNVANYKGCIDAIKKVRYKDDPYLVDMLATAEKLAADTSKTQ